MVRQAKAASGGAATWMDVLNSAIRSWGGLGGSATWLGSDQEFAQLLKAGDLAARKGNSNASVAFPGTTYWVGVNRNRPLF